ncbi:hypothetical protein ACIBO1_02555 [Micromonospora sp. NPDC049903]|uniref:hypothetical protein n=1 Tax=Micromonospora sp. NPDC049903 TaxID=3364276 RepID=UPI0037BB1AAE
MSERSAQVTIAAGYSATEWELLTGLPGRVIVVAARSGPGDAYPSVAAGLAGLDAVAAGRVFDSDLIRAVVAAIYARHDGAPETSAGPGDGVDLLAACRTAVRVLERRADPADSAAYRQWVQSVGARVCRTASAVVPDAALAPADRRFLDRLGGALALR